VDQEEAEWNVNIYKGRRIERQLNCKKYYFGGKGGEGRCSEVKSWYMNLGKRLRSRPRNSWQYGVRGWKISWWGRVAGKIT
jgi:hypothetical protein